ncbi:ArsC family reductase [Crenobacter sp. SG2303]|uniref:ArsC family reductase n=1 Tax=Crenobacter oryzisoli TaxID=3056844 RepID=A0ABT7XR65_9NEIS|nr:ArsC family reductase [Crenobacter sp. SG2303]MDN0076288.1 ArsC family reductase [Crenobacter sp. SG2303]
MTTLYGIPNCSTVKKARLWLTEHQIDYTFHDFKKQGIDAGTLSDWVARIGLVKLINRQGTTWRKLSDVEKARADSVEGAITLLIEQPSLIKRPVLITGQHAGVGFSEASYTEEFGQ